MFNLSNKKTSIFSSKQTQTSTTTTKQPKVTENNDKVQELTDSLLAKLMLNTADAPRNGGFKGKDSAGNKREYDPAGQAFCWIMDNVGRIISEDDARFLTKASDGRYEANDDAVSSIMYSYVSLYYSMLYWYTKHSFDTKKLLQGIVEKP